MLVNPARWQWLWPLAVLVPLAAFAQVEPLPEPPGGSGATGQATGSAFMIATADPRATTAGREVLAAGGSAVDAMVAAQFVLNLVEPQSSGIGGGAFLVHRAADGTITTLDGRETAPAAAGPDLLLGQDGRPLPFAQALVGGRAVGAPGTLRLLEAAHRRFGVRPWAELAAPAITLAEGGFTVGPRLAQGIAQALPQGLDRFAPSREYFAPAGVPAAVGSTLRNPAFAETLRVIADGGADAFYRGPIAAALVRTVREAPGAPGLLAEADLAAYAAIERPPVCAPYRRWTVCGMGPPSSGGVAVLQILGLLERFDLAGIGPGAAGYHLLLEAQKLAVADRNAFLADPDRVPVPVVGLLDRGYLQARSRLIEPALALPVPVAAGTPPTLAAAPPAAAGQEAPGTSHLVAVDAAGNALSFTTTIEAGFGSRLVTGGFLLNNELTDFAFLPEAGGRPVANRVEGGKRPRSSMAPTIVLDQTGRPVLLLGSPGGGRIIGYVAKTLVAFLDWGLPLPAAIELGHAVNLNGPSELEAGTAAAAFGPALEALGHRLSLAPQPSGLQAIGWGPSGLQGVADPRREGAAAGG